MCQNAHGSDLVRILQEIRGGGQFPFRTPMKSDSSPERVAARSPHGETNLIPMNPVQLRPHAGRKAKRQDFVKPATGPARKPETFVKPRKGASKNDRGGLGAKPKPQFGKRGDREDAGARGNPRGKPNRDRASRDRDSEPRGRGERKGKPGREERGGPRATRPRAPGLQFAGYRDFKATIDKNRKGFGFLIFENRKLEDAFVPPRDADRFFHGDRVEVTMNSRGDISNVRVLEHRFREIVGKYNPNPSPREGRAGWVTYERKKAREEVLIPDPGHKAKLGEWVRVQLDFHDGEEDALHPVTGRIVETYGDHLPPSADVGMIAAEYNLIEAHPPESEAEAKGFKLDLDLTHREDLRQVPFITIDGETARDFDDAIFVERETSGFVLWVAIADVSHYVTPGSPIDEDAHSRGTSVYFPERAFHMLPRALSENLCSLRPDEPRLTLVARMEYDRQGHRTATQMMEAVILSKRRATYNEIQKEWEERGKDPNWEYAPHFELYRLIRKNRAARGSIDFDLPEANLVVKPTGEVESITLRERLDAHRLIEEFMVSANEAVTEWAMEREWPFIYRVHEEPAEQSLVKFQKLAAHMGVSFSVDGSSETLPQRLNALVATLDGTPGPDDAQHGSAQIDETSDLQLHSRNPLRPRFASLHPLH